MEFIFGIILLLIIAIAPIVIFVKLAFSRIQKQFAPVLERYGTSEPLPQGKILLRWFYTKAAKYDNRVWMAGDSNNLYFEIPKIGNLRIPLAEISAEVKDLQGNNSFLFIVMNLKSMESVDTKVKDIRIWFRKSDLKLFPQIEKMM